MVISYPRPPFSNPNIEPGFFQPSVFEISSITTGFQTVIQTTIDHNFSIGQEVRMIIPEGYGIRELNEMQGIVISIPNDDEILININSSGFNAFINAAASTPAQVTAIGDINSGNPSVTISQDIPAFIPGSFINISPQ